MNEREMRELLQEVIDDVDSGRVEVEKPRVLKVAGPLLALAIGLAGCSGPGNKHVKDPGDNRSVAAQPDSGVKVVPRPPPPDMRVRIPPPVPAYGVPIARPRPKPMKDPGPVAEYAAPVIEK